MNCRASMLSALTLLLALAVLTSPAAAERLTPRGERSLVQLDGRRGDLLRELSVEQGKSVVLQPQYAVKRVSVGDPEIADVIVLGATELQLVAKQVGETNVVLWDRAGEARAAIDVAVGRPFSGVERDFRRVVGNQDIQIETAGEAVVLKGTVSSVEAMDRALRIAEAYFPGKREEGRIINLLEVGANQQVMIEVTIAEMSRSLTREMESNFVVNSTSGNHSVRVFNFLENLVGLDGDLTTADAVLLSDRVNLVAGFTTFGSTSAAAYLNFLQEKGLVKVLAEPTLVARSGQSASFLAGGEVPIPIAQGGAFGSITIEYKEFGVLVAFSPTVLSEERIHMEISPEVSEPDFTLGTSVDGTAVPGFRTRRASTGVELGDGQSFAIAGLLRDDVAQMASQYPLLGDIPILGTLFRSKSYQKRESELVLIVRPHLVKPLPAGRPPLPTDDFVEPSDYDFYLTSALQGRQEAGPHQVSPGGLIGDAGHRVSIQSAEKELK